MDSGLGAFAPPRNDDIHSLSFRGATQSRTRNP